MSFEEGALLEPLSVGLHAVRRGRIRPEDRVLCSDWGRLACLPWRRPKCPEPLGIWRDVVEYRRNLALQMGASGVINPMGESVSRD